MNAAAACLLCFVVGAGSYAIGRSVGSHESDDRLAREQKVADNAWTAERAVVKLKTPIYIAVSTSKAMDQCAYEFDYSGGTRLIASGMCPMPGLSFGAPLSTEDGNP